MPGKQSAMTLAIRAVTGAWQPLARSRPSLPLAIRPPALHQRAGRPPLGPPNHRCLWPSHRRRVPGTVHCRRARDRILLHGALPVFGAWRALSLRISTPRSSVRQGTRQDCRDCGRRYQRRFRHAGHIYCCPIVRSHCRLHWRSPCPGNSGISILS